MKSMWPPLVDISFMTYFYRAGGAWPPLPPPESATESSLKIGKKLLITMTYGLQFAYNLTTVAVATHRKVQTLP